MKKSILVLAAAILVVAGGSAEAAHLMTSSDIQDGTIRGKDIHKGAISSSLLTRGLRQTISAKPRLNGTAGPAGPKGDKGDKGDKGNKGDKGDKGDQGPGFIQSNWGVIDRNTIGSPQIDLRQGPGTPPFGSGSLEFLVGSSSEKAAYGNEVDFAGQNVSDLANVAFDVFQTGEDQTANGGANNLPNIAIEINPHTSRTFSTMVYEPAGPAANINAWSHFDATTNGQWYFTGGFGADTGCNQTTMCTFADARADASSATILSVAVDKGRDDAWQGAVDGLRINGTVYDFEQLGVKATPAS